MSVSETLSLLASIAALILAVVAIWLSIVFFRMSSQLSEGAREAAKGIGASVERLEKLFDKLYADTFSMMRDTVSDMRKHIWPEDTSTEKVAEEAEKRADEKIQGIREGLQDEIRVMLRRQKITDERRQRVTDEKLATLTDEMRSLIDKAISSSRQVEVEAREEAVRDHVLSTLQHLSHREQPVTADEVVGQSPFPVSRVVRELKRLRREGRIFISDSDIAPETIISFDPM